MWHQMTHAPRESQVQLAAKRGATGNNGVLRLIKGLRAAHVPMAARCVGCVIKEHAEFNALVREAGSSSRASSAAAPARDAITAYVNKLVIGGAEGLRAECAGLRIDIPTSSKLHSK